ncbi:MAG TPA: hypothetical protein DCZ91_06625 [Lachnospiraceae bacterium]|nr:hypothetical protein [Lachnospiraceae bacterium]
MKGFFQKSRFRKYFYFLCFFILCVCDQRVGSASGEIQLVCPNVILMVLSCIALSHYPLSSFRRRPFLISAVVFAAGSLLALFLIWPNTYYHYQLISGVIAAILYGCVLTQTVLAIFSAKRLPQGNPLGAGLLGLLMVLMLLSHHDRYNGFLLCLSVLLLYLTDFTVLECEWMLKALGCSVLTAFFIFQGMAFVFRPYDSLRYLGLYANTNMNALFYQMVYCVFLCLFCILELKKGHGLLKWGSFCFACAMWSFVLLTMCRSAVLGMGAATGLGLGITLWKRRGRRLGRGLVYAGALALGCVLSFPVVYGAVRYLPAAFHHPVWFMDEYSEEKVHSWDPWDSEKYTDWRDVLQENFGRFFPGAMEGAPAEPDGEVVAPVLLVSAKADPGLEGAGFLPSAAIYDETGSEAGVSAEEAPGAGYSVAARLTIYRYYLSQLNLLGHADSENGLQIDEGYYAPHAHNIVLQYAFNYGLPAGIVFLLYLASSGICYLILCIRNGTDTPFLLGLLLFVSIAGFGMMEIIWRYGQLSHMLLLLLPRFAWQSRSDTTGSF